jgi:putative solute:sodium symporter small subunit
VSDNPPMQLQARQVFWSRLRRLTFVLLGLWFLGNLALPWFARDLSKLSILGFPGGFWVVAQGALLVYLGLVVAYSAIVNRMERRFLGTLEPDDMASSSQFPR